MKDSLLRLAVSLPKTSGEQKCQLRFPICFQPHRSEVRECCIKTILTISELLIFGTLCCQFWGCPAANLQGSELEPPELRPAERSSAQVSGAWNLRAVLCIPFLSACISVGSGKTAVELPLTDVKYQNYMQREVCRLSYHEAAARMRNHLHTPKNNKARSKIRLTSGKLP